MVKLRHEVIRNRSATSLTGHKRVHRIYANKKHTNQEHVEAMMKLFFAARARYVCGHGSPIKHDSETKPLIAQLCVLVSVIC
jgi:hypothetical protein